MYVHFLIHAITVLKELITVTFLSVFCSLLLPVFQHRQRRFFSDNEKYLEYVKA